jgi:hypothetical protein
VVIVPSKSVITDHFADYRVVPYDLIDDPRDFLAESHGVPGDYQPDHYGALYDPHVFPDDSQIVLNGVLVDPHDVLHDFLYAAQYAPALPLSRHLAQIALPPGSP